MPFPSKLSASSFPVPAAKMTRCARSARPDTTTSPYFQALMDDATEGVVAMAAEQRVDLRSAATMLAVKRVADATTLRGLYP